MTIPPPILGATYQSEQIVEMVGAPPTRPLSVVRDRVVCGCFDKAWSPSAPFAVLLTDSEPAQRAVGLLKDQHAGIPVFLLQAEGRWEYFGEYEFDRYSTDREDVARENTAGREGIAGVLYLRAVPYEDRPSADRRP